jgi:hypothetical protein
MTLDGIMWRFLKLSAHDNSIVFPENVKVQLLYKACPSLKYTAKYDAAEYYDYYVGSIPKEQVRKYVLFRHEFDAIDIGRIVSVFEAYREEHK